MIRVGPKQSNDPKDNYGANYDRVQWTPSSCPQHPRYLAKRAPQSACPVCARIWKAKQAAR